MNLPRTDILIMLLILFSLMGFDELIIGEGYLKEVTVET